jgi:hypothetical protein
MNAPTPIGFWNLGMALMQCFLSDMAVNGTFGVSMIAKGYPISRPIPSSGSDVLLDSTR